MRNLPPGKTAVRKNTTYLFLQEGCFGVFSWIKNRFCWFEQEGKLLTFFHIINSPPSPQYWSLTCPKIAKWSTEPVSEDGLIARCGCLSAQHGHVHLWDLVPWAWSNKVVKCVISFMFSRTGPQQDLKANIYMNSFLDQPCRARYLLVWDASIHQEKVCGWEQGSFKAKHDLYSSIWSSKLGESAWLLLV